MDDEIRKLNEIIADIEIDKVIACFEREERRRRFEEQELQEEFQRAEKFDNIFAILHSTLMGIGGLIMFLLYSDIDNRQETKVFYDDNLFSNQKIVADDSLVADIHGDLEKELGITISDEKLDDYLVLNAVYENENLEEREKEVCYGMLPLIEDNPYLNKEKAYNSLLNVDVDYIKRPKIYSERIEGIFSPYDISIDIFVKDSDNRVLNHEVIHSIFSNHLPRFFDEGMTELLSNEYFSDMPYIELINYPFEVIAVKMLSDIVGADNVLEAYSTDDMNKIYRTLDSLTGNYGEAKKFFVMLDKVFDEYDDEAKFDLGDAMFVFNSFDEYASLSSTVDKNSYSYNRNLLCSLYTSDPFDNYLEKLFDGYYAKAYFSDDLKKSATSDIMEDTAKRLLK